MKKPLHALMLSAALYCTGTLHAQDIPDFGNQGYCSGTTGAERKTCMIGQAEYCAQTAMKDIRPDYVPHRPLDDGTSDVISMGTTDRNTVITLFPEDLTGLVGITITERTTQFGQANGRAFVTGGTVAEVVEVGYNLGEEPDVYASKYGKTPISAQATLANVVKGMDTYQSCMTAAVTGPMRRYVSQFPASSAIDAAAPSPAP